MLSEPEFIAWCNCLNLPQKTQELIEQIRSSDPSRRVGGGRKNVAGRYPSRKMGCIIQFESHKVELPHIYELERDDNVLEYYDQPPLIKLDYQGKNGRNLGVLHTPDYFVIRKDNAGWEECKTEEELKKLSQKSPNRYVCSENYWHCPPGENYAQSWRLYYRLWSDATINWILQRNLIFLEDYYRSKTLNVAESTANTMIELVTSKQGIKLSELLARSDDFTADDIYSLIVQDNLYIDLQKNSLTEPDNCAIFLNQKVALAYDLMQKSSLSSFPSLSLVNLAIGASLLWDNRVLKILNIGEKEITLRGDKETLVTLKIEEVELLIQQKKISSLSSPQTLSSPNSEAWEQFYQASPEDQAEALKRYQIIESYLRGEKRENEIISPRTIRDWKAKYITAQQQYGCGYVGLLSHRQKKGNRQHKLPQASLDLMTEFITKDYETLKQKSMWSVYCSLLEACEQKGLIAPSYKTFTLEVKKRSQYEQTKKRKGRRAAYNRETFYWELKKTTPRHGKRLFGTSNTQFIDNLSGNTQITKNVRQVTKSVNPKKHAIWTLGQLYEQLCTWAYEVYDTLDHPALGQSPREAFSLGMSQGGNRSHKIIPYDDNFKILTLPTTSTGKAKIQPSTGIKINYIYYWANIFRDPEVEKTRVPVRYDPFDAGIAYAYVRGYWVKCTSQYYSEFQGRSEKEIKLATKELGKRFSNYQKNSKISAKKLAQFLNSLEAEELLLQQRQHDTEAKEVFQIINGGEINQNTLFTATINFVDSDEYLIADIESPDEDFLSSSLEVYEGF